MNDYEAKREARIERMRARAGKLAGEAAAASASAHAIMDRIPMGQPILVGHHSEKRHRGDIARIDGKLAKSVAAHREAEELARRADRAEASEAVSSDDPGAVAKLRGKLAEMAHNRERMKAANAAIRAGGDVPAALATLGFRADTIAHVLKPDFSEMKKAPMPREGHRRFASRGRIMRAWAFSTSGPEPKSRAA